MLRLGNYDVRRVRCRGRLQGLRLRIELVHVSAGGAQVAERPHHAAVISAAAHGRFSKCVTFCAAADRAALLPTLALLIMGMVMSG